MIIAVFRSRGQSLDYAERLHRFGVEATTAPAPKEAKIGCGLCVRFEPRFFPRAKAVLRSGGYSTFKGFYSLEFVAGRLSVQPYNR